MSPQASSTPSSARANARLRVPAPTSLAPTLRMIRSGGRPSATRARSRGTCSRATSWTADPATASTCTRHGGPSSRATKAAGVSSTRSAPSPAATLSPSQAIRTGDPAPGYQPSAVGATTHGRAAVRMVRAACAWHTPHSAPTEPGAAKPTATPIVHHLAFACCIAASIRGE